jgi:succinoglycan biosynthesis protein ExoO
LDHSLHVHGETADASETARPRVTVLIAAYRAAGFIENTIATALNQEGVEVDVLVVDDHSDDDTGEVITRLAARDSRVSLLVLPENQGPAGARNLGLRAAKGDWIAILDADDAFLSGRLRHLVELALNTDADIVADNFHFVDGEGTRLGRTALKRAPVCEILDIYSFLEGARPFTREADYGLLKPVIRKSFVIRVGLNYRAEIRHGEDFHLIIDALRNGARYVVSREPFYLYTARTSGKSRTLIDYKGMIQRTQALQQTTEDPRVHRLLALRARSLSKLQTSRQLDSYRSSGQYSMMIRAVISEPGGWSWANRLIRQAVRRVLKPRHRL